MNWTDDDVKNAWRAAFRLDIGSRESTEAIMTHAVELAAARGGTMTAEELRFTALERVGMTQEQRLREHIAAQGARVATLEQERDEWREKWQGATENAAKALEHVSELEKSLGGARKERDDHMRAAQEWEGRYKTAALERYAALADNAAKDAALAEYIEFHGAEHEEEDCPEDDTCQCPRLVALNKAFGPTHPGVALLVAHRKEIDFWKENVATVCAERDTERRLRMEQEGEHRKALVRARNAGLEKAAQVVETADDGVPLQMLADDGIRTLKEPYPQGTERHAVEVPTYEVRGKGESKGYDDGVEAMRAACLRVLREVMQAEGWGYSGVGTVHRRLKVAIEGAMP